MVDYDYVLRVEQKGEKVDLLALHQKDVSEEYFIFKYTGTIYDHNIVDFIKKCRERIHNEVVKLEFVNTSGDVDDIRILQKLGNCGYTVDGDSIVKKHIKTPAVPKTNFQEDLVKSLLEDGYTIKQENGKIIIVDK